MLDRIQELLRVRELSSSQFADAIGVSRPVVSHILSGRNKPSLEVVQKILAAFPDLSLNWLLNGAGPMLERSVAPATIPSEPTPKVVPRAQPAKETSSAVAPAPPVVPERVVAPLSATEPVVAPLSASEPRPAGPAASSAPLPPPAGAEMAYALAEPGKAIRRIVLFYQDGTFADFRPEAGL